MICTNLGSPIWLLNTIREHECLVMYLDSQEAFADWFKQAHSKRPIAPPDTGTSVSNVYGTRGLTQRLQAEEAKKSYEAQLERWHHELQLDTDLAAEKLMALLTYPKPGWLVDIDEPGMNKTDDTADEATSDVVGKDDGFDRPGETGDVNVAESSRNCDLTGLGESPESRKLQMHVLRESCLTTAVFFLIRLFQTANMHQECVDLVNLVAAERSDLAKLFSKSQRRKLIDLITDSMEHLRAKEGDPLGYPMEPDETSTTRSLLSGTSSVSKVVSYAPHKCSQTIEVDESE
ncbi:unnamed protein product [Calicophoron daubneyi]|uniref:Nuclear pore complex protein n=1 Tax=Calicophoron daubneyi TaxID=300641 RepID=A0AAV2SY30_CALDB